MNNHSKIRNVFGKKKHFRKHQYLEAVFYRFISSRNMVYSSFKSKHPVNKILLEIKILKR